MDRNKIILLVLFLIMVAAQIYVPASMVGFNEDIVQNGKEILLEVAPIDPNDPFRGKYITLNFKYNEVDVKKDHDWINGDKAFLEFGRDTFGLFIQSFLYG